MFASLMQLDGNILLFIQDNIRNPVLTPVMKFITHFADKGLFWIILTLVLLIPKRTRRFALCSFFAMICSIIISNLILKNLVARTRPYDMIESLRILVSKPDDFSFPSGHSSISFSSSVAFARSLPERYRAVGVCMIVFAALIALSRLYVGVHFPTDVICGTLIGIFCGFAGVWLEQKAEDRIPMLPDKLL